jgi:hypothetical protein
MEEQLDRYGIRHNVWKTPRYEDIRDIKRVMSGISGYPLMPDIQIGAMISNIDNMRRWFETTDEPYAIFCDDDISFESIDYWNFNWSQFYNGLPGDWECVQLIRMHDNLDLSISDLSLKIMVGRWWGAAFMFKREYVRFLLRMFINEDGSYNLISNHGMYIPCVENILTLNYHMVYNFPLLIENNDTLVPTVKNEPTYPNEAAMRSARKICNQIIRHQWQHTAANLDIKTALRI